MDVRNCKKCGKLFNYVSGPMICQHCKEELEEKFQEVKKYVSEHPGCGIPEVTEECDVTSNQIRQWLREERLEFSANTQVGLTCENCGAPVRCGRFCAKCKNNMANNLQGMYKKKKTIVERKPDTKDNPRMHFLDR